MLTKYKSLQVRVLKRKIGNSPKLVFQRNFKEISKKIELSAKDVNAFDSHTKGNSF